MVKDNFQGRLNKNALEEGDWTAHKIATAEISLSAGLPAEGLLRSPRAQQRNPHPLEGYLRLK